MADDEAQDKLEGESVTVSLDEAFATALCAHREGRFPEAARVYRQILDVVPEHVDALHFLGVAEHQAGRAQVALGLLDRALALAPEHADALCNRGNVHRSLHHLDAAEADYRKSLGLRPDDPNTLGNLGTVLRARGDLDGAVAAFRAALDQNPEHASTWQNLAGTYAAMQRRSEATAAYQQAARLNPGSADMFRNLGMALYSEGRVREAIEMYRHCLALAPDDVRAAYLLKACTGEDAPTRAPDAYVRAEFDHFAASFDAKLAALDYRGPALVTEAVRAVVGELPARPTVLDAGCGTGLCGPLLRPLSGNLVGIDLSTGMLDRARARAVYDELVVAELTAFLRAHGAAYDVIVSADTLVYFGDLTCVVTAAAAALRPGGVLVFTLEKAEPDQAPSGFRLNPHGRYSHTAEYVVRTLVQAGFEPTLGEVATRKEADAWVPGWLLRARRSR